MSYQYAFRNKKDSGEIQILKIDSRTLETKRLLGQMMLVTTAGNVKISKQSRRSKKL